MRWPVLIAVATLVGLFGSRSLTGDADAGVTLQYYLETGQNPSSHPVTAASPVATPVPKLSPAIYATLPGLNALGIYPIAGNGNVPSLVGNASISNPGGVGYWGGRLYVTNVATDSITVYPATAFGSTNPVVTIKGEKPRLDNPTSIAFDSAGNIYVANAGKSGGGRESITKYAAGSSGDVAPISEITGDAAKLSSPSGLTVDSSGNIYVANEGSDSITVYSPGSTGNAAPAKVISGSSTQLDRPAGVAVDSKGNVYATSFGAEGNGSVAILVYAKDSTGNVAPSQSIDGDCAVLSCPGAIALDASANIYVTNPSNPASGDESVAVFTHDTFTPGYTGQCITPAYNIFGPKTGIADPSGIAVDSVGGIYVANSDANANDVVVFQTGDNGNVTPTAIIGTPSGIFAPTSVALDSSGKIYVANGSADRQVANSVTIYAPGSNAATAPVAVIGGDYGGTDKADINSPFAVAVDKQGKIYVANQADGYNFDGSITVYSAGSTGNVAPVAKISGSKTGDNTGLKTPKALSVDAANRLYVLNEFGNGGQGAHITIYPPGASGNIAPEATIADGSGGGHTRLNSPAGLALDSGGDIYVTNDGGSGSIAIYAAGSKGDVAPKKIISGSNTGLATPRGIAIDSKGNIYVANASDGVVTDEGEDDNDSGHKAPATITVYPPGSNGNVAPIRTIAGPLTSLEHPEGIAIGLANLTPPLPQALAYYDWSVKASPDVAAQLASKEVVERFVRSISISVPDRSGLAGGTQKLRSYKFADLRHDGFVSLVAETGPDGAASCSDSHHSVFCAVYIVDKTRTGFEIYKAFGSIDIGGGTVPLGVQDLGHDGNLEVIVSQAFASIYGRCIATWPAIYAWTGHGYTNVSDRYKNLYRGQIDALNKLIQNLPPTGPSYDQRDKECLQAEVAKLQRLLGSPNAGLEEAIAFTKSKDQMKIVFGIYDLMAIDTPEARQYLNTLRDSPDPNAKSVMKQMAYARSKEMDTLFSQFVRLL